MINNTESSNTLLAQAEQKIESQLTPENKANYLKAVVAGLKAGMSGGPDSILASLKDSKDPIRDCALGAINLSLILRKQSRNSMPLKCMIPAAMTLTLKALGFAEKIGLIKVGEPEVAQAAHIFADHLMKCFNITPEMLQTAVGNVHGLTNDPGAMQKMQGIMGQQQAPATPAAGATP